MSIAMLGGILLVIGAYFTFKGDIFKSVGTYFLADVAWVALAFQAGDVTGAIFIFIGMTLGLLAFLKMQTGKMRKDLSLD